MSVPVPPESLPVPDGVPDSLPNTIVPQRQFPMEPYRSAPQSEGDDPYGAFLRFTKLFSGLRVRWNADKPHRVTSTLKNRAEMLHWDPKALRVIEGLTGISTTVPRRCPGRVVQNKDRPAGCLGCPCEVMHGANPDVWKGSLCPSETVRAYQHFVRYVRELEIAPDDQVDVQQILDIIQLHLVEDRCTEDIQISGLFDDKIGGVAQSKAIPFYERQASSAVALRERCQKQRLVLYKTMMATRAEREQMRAARAKEKVEDKKGETFANLADLFTAVRSHGIIDTTFKELPSDEESEDFD